MGDTVKATEGGDLEDFLEALQATRSFEFSGYKRATLARRIDKRMTEVGMPNYEAYLDHLQANPREFAELFNTILINVTSFFRDAEAWDYLAEEIIPNLLKSIPAQEQIRVWSAGCASGEEAYTIAIVLLEALGEKEFKRRVKIYATDVDEEALAIGRAGIYVPEALQPLPRESVERFFVDNGGSFAFRPDLRRSVIFGRNELLADAPISRLDLLICRNVLMYFTVEAQAKILSQFNFALRDRGFLFLGKSEMLTRHSEFFAPVDVKWRVFRRLPRRHLGERLNEVFGRPLLGEDAALAQRYADLREAAASVGPVARLVVDSSRFLVDSNGLANDLFSIGPADIGRPLQDLEVSYRPLELRNPLDRAFAQAQPVKAGRVEIGDPGEERIYEVEITPVEGEDEGPNGAAITFTDITDYARLVAENDKSKRELVDAYEELQSTVEELETTNEELQSTNEELETTNEELETTNEELQTANEELQTMNEEMTSTSDELEVMNEEQREHGEEVDRLNLFLEGILSNLQVGVAVVDRENRVQLWNEGSRELWGLHADEVAGKDFFALSIGLPTKQLRESLDVAISDAHQNTDLTLAAMDRHGQKFNCEVSVMPLFSANDGLFGSIVLMRQLVEEESAEV
jgi:two-component system CheB/CheR fusion protein